ncbi:EAL domain-containing protein [Lachnobacterium bovis]|uniref:EAL domain, c-di-GMP-specific phosphodiesterase class I (Or its enzymatically inactive variant) n=1 Tax=Lachnobacterium bovis TaxID=140626 RepID=A0A1H9PUK5_9FIRM|nr:EAL domain-containing protein [Lachnobacterium bovis]SER51293.1 EAL domain, c-di-GMP-specific phosphodiesterase class I (or its enzymatically inactive variant) [Lachnobacterium bovis]
MSKLISERNTDSLITTYKKDSMLSKLFEVFSITAEGSYVYLCNIKNDFSRWSKEAVDFFDLPNEYMYNAGAIWEEHIHPDDREQYRKDIDAIFSGSSNSHNMRYRAKARDGSYVLCSCRGLVFDDDDGIPTYFAGTITNHGYQSNIDAITNLKNIYSYFEEFSNSSMFGFTVSLFGISNFSDLNNIYGYEVGNHLLKVFSEYLENTFNNIDQIYRMEGTKFLILSKNYTIQDMNDLFEKMKEELRLGLSVDNLKLSLFIGGSCLYVSSKTVGAHTIYSCLKSSYYESINLKQGDFAIFEKDLDGNLNERLEQLNTIRDSIVKDFEGFFLCYQPIVDSKTEELVGVEALIRWKNDKYGLVPPIYFIPILEKDSSFSQLGDWIIHTALKEMKPLLEKYPNLEVNINLSYTQLEKKEFINTIEKIITQVNFPKKNLCLEITERCRLLDIDLLNNFTKSLRNEGIRFALDDFGTGFSSFSVLKNINVDIVKIDRAFIKNICDSNPDKIIVNSISKLCQEFNIDLCIEGVETNEIKEYLKQIYVTCFQGYLFSKPLTKEEFYNKYL